MTDKDKGSVSVRGVQSEKDTPGLRAQLCRSLSKNNQRRGKAFARPTSHLLQLQRVGLEGVPLTDDQIPVFEHAYIVSVVNHRLRLR